MTKAYVTRRNIKKSPLFILEVGCQSALNFESGGRQAFLHFSSSLAHAYLR